ncbi:hypothetical protein QYM36_013629 [Artemia franciscana]|uniref:Uncharacterized protein n=1 Tax=Artemia franciscana TaxID=6661 RepID=A0AA88HQZ6_ARTSF|nr:hypothetical protein QYM36_013629 [Artemia franciscana]
MSQLLVSKGATIDALDSLKCIPLYLAVTGNHIDVISYLLFKGANPNAESESHAGRESVLHVAVGNDNLKICQLLVSNGATIDPRNSWQYTPLCLAVRRNDITVTSYLLENGANPNVETYHYDDQVKESVLHIAARNSNFDICQLLISKGADVNCLTSNNETALMIALNNILLHKVHHLSNIAIVIIEYLLKNEAICISKNVGDVKDKYRKIFKQVFASNLYFQKINMWYRIMLDWEPINERILCARFATSQAKLTVIVVYAPTKDTVDQTKDDFYRVLSNVVAKAHRHDIVTLCGDFNAKVGSDASYEPAILEIAREITPKIACYQCYEVVINKLYKSSSLELHLVLDRIKRELKAYRLDTSNLENRVEKLEVILDDITQ